MLLPHGLRVAQKVPTPTIKQQKFGTAASGSLPSITFDSTATSGNSLIAVFGSMNSGATPTTPSGWTLSASYNFSARGSYFIYSKTSNGTETSLSITPAGTAASSLYFAEIANGKVSTLTFSSGANGSNRAPDSSVCTASSATNPKLYFSFFSVSSTITTSSTVVPTGMTELAKGTSFGIASITTSASSYDPDVWSISNTVGWVAGTASISN